MEEDNSIEQAAPVADEAQIQPAVDAVESSTDSPEISADKEEKILGKFNSVDDLAKSYQELERKFTQTNQTRNQVVEEQVPETGYDANGLPFDEATLQGLDTFFEQRLAEREEVREAQKFVKAHAEELKNPFVDARTRDLIKSGVPREDALTKAKTELEAMTNPKIQAAKTEGVQEGQELAQKKEQLGAIGQPGASGKVDPSKLGAKEFATYTGLTYVE